MSLENFKLYTATNNELILPQANSISGEISIPGSKSIANRAILLSALYKPGITLYNIPNNDDILSMIKALRSLGCNIILDKDENSLKILEGLKIDSNIEIFSGDAGTVLRPLVSALCLIKSKYNITLKGSEQLNKRPILELVESLKECGANIEYLKEYGYPPILIKPSQNFKTEIKIDSSRSSQFVSSLLISLPLRQDIKVIKIINKEIISKSYIDMTIKMMEDFGIKYEFIENSIYLREKKKSPLNSYNIEPDMSSASYFLAAASIQGEITIKHINAKSLQGDYFFIKALKNMGALISQKSDNLTIKSKTLKGIYYDAINTPDSALTLAVLAVFADGKTYIDNIESWRFKECNRLQAMENELTKIGAKITISSNHIEIVPPRNIRDAIINTYFDHRIAMSFSLLAFSKAKISILNPKCVIKTFPNYFDSFFKLIS